jgi:hypothetical protein
MGSVRGYILPDLETLPIDQRFGEVMAHFGLAHYLAQVLEHLVINFLFVTRRLEHIKKSIPFENWQEVFDSESARLIDGKIFFGTLISEVKKLKFFSIEVEKSLEKCVLIRNRLAHRFIREHSENLLQTGGQQKSLAAFWDAIRLFESTLNVARSEMIPLLEAAGLDEQLLANHEADCLAVVMNGGHINPWHSEV